MFAGLNLLRVGAMKKMNLKEFEFSQNYTLFWDKFERANYFLEAIIETADRDVDDRTVAFLLDRPLEDGGQWNMFINIVQKHGVVPKAVMPETESSSNTRPMNSVLLWKLREGAKTLRELHTTVRQLRSFAPRSTIFLPPSIASCAFTLARRRNRLTGNGWMRIARFTAMAS
jgi:aminopeptidase C